MIPPHNTMPPINDAASKCCPPEVGAGACVVGIEEAGVTVVTGGESVVPGPENKIIATNPYFCHTQGILIQSILDPHLWIFLLKSDSVGRHILI